MRPFVSLATDFGAAYTAICAGVIYNIAPTANVLILSDEITPYAITEGAMLLRQALPYLPIGVHVGIVDPGVGTPRHPVAVRTGRGDVLIGPDNGLLAPAAEKLGGMVTAHRLENPAYRLREVSTSFHGRDIFSPAAAHVASGVPITELGPQTDLLALDVPPPVHHDSGLTVPILYTDRYGSLILGAERADLTEAFGDLPYGTSVTLAWTTPEGDHTTEIPFMETFGSRAPGEPLLWIDSSGWLGLAINQGSAAETLNISGSVTLHR